LNQENHKHSLTRTAKTHNTYQLKLTRHKKWP